jgi:hypothetical protein
MTWNPFKNGEESEVPNPEVGPDGKPIVTPPVKTPAELIAESLSPLTDGISKLNARLDTIEQATKPKPKPETPPEQVSVLDDENLAFAQRITPLMLRQLELEARIVRNDIKGEYASAGYAELWAQFEKDINSTLDNTPVVTSEGKPFRGDPQYIRNLVDMVMGRAARAAGMKFDGKGKGFFLETGGSGAEGSHVPVEDGLSNDQRKMFNRMKVPLDDAKKVMAKLKFVAG